MNTEWLMRLSAFVMGGVGLAASFFPGEILAHYGAPDHWAAELAVQVLGSLYLGFALLNWMARSNLIGGIYSRPVALGNFLHFTVVAITLSKVLMDGRLMVDVIAGFALYAIFAVWFGLVLFTNPFKARSDLSTTRPENKMEPAP